MIPRFGEEEKLPCPKCGGTGWHIDADGYGVPCKEDHSKYGCATPQSVEEKWLKIADHWRKKQPVLTKAIMEKMEDESSD